jgi:Undecaprenyl-phosphate glucose phosphotransferase
MLTKSQNIVLGQVLFEFFLLNICLLIVLFLVIPGTFFVPLEKVYLTNFLQLALIFNLSWGLIILVNGDSDFYRSSNLRKRMRYLLLNTLIFIGIAYILGNLFKIDQFNPTTLLLPIFLFAVAELILFGPLISFFKEKSPGSFAPNILIVGANGRLKQLTELGDKIQREGYQIAGVLGNERAANGTNGMEVTGQVQDLARILDTDKIDKIFIKLSELEEKEIKYAIETADYYGIRVNLVPDTPKILENSFKPVSLKDFPVFKLRQSPLDNFNNSLVKKIFDFLFALTVVILLSPVFLLISILILLDSRGPLLYCPIRKGEKGETFRCYKFRTMTECDDPINGTRSTVKNDPRLTRVGKFLRKWDLDELPQFFNVLKGDMSVVGPRPHRVFLQNDFRKIINDYMVRHYVKPGITGWAQVNGWRGPTKTEEQKKKRIQYDLWYIENWSLWLDLRIIFLTVFGKKTRKNAF